MKLKDKFILHKRILLFMFIIGITGIITGSILVNILNLEDKQLVIEYINRFVDSVKNNNLDYVQALKNNLTTNIIYLLLIWISGISMIGFPIIIFLFFSKLFVTGFSIGSILYTYKIKGLLFSLFYVFPGSILSIISALLLGAYGIKLSFKLIYILSCKKTVDLKQIIIKYTKVFLVCLLIGIIGIISDTFLMPYLIKLIITFID